MKKRINNLKGIMAVALSIMIFATNAMTVLAADWVTGSLLGSEDTINFQPAENDTVTTNYGLGMVVFVDGIQQGGTIANNGSYTIPAGVTGATLTNPAPQATNRPLELRITTINGSQTPSVNSGLVGSGVGEPERISESVKVEEPKAIYHHQCTYEWIVTLEPTLQDDGICSHICEECGSVDATQPISRYQAIFLEISKKIEKAPQGATVKINYDFLESFPASMIALIDGRKDLVFDITFESNKKDYNFTIPARKEGENIAEEGVDFYGFHYLGDKYDKKEIVE